MSLVQAPNLITHVVLFWNGNFKKLQINHTKSTDWRHFPTIHMRQRLLVIYSESLFIRKMEIRYHMSYGITASHNIFLQRIPNKELPSIIKHKRKQTKNAKIKTKSKFAHLPASPDTRTPTRGRPSRYSFFSLCLQFN